MVVDALARVRQWCAEPLGTSNTPLLCGYLSYNTPHLYFWGYVFGYVIMQLHTFTRLILSYSQGGYMGGLAECADFALLLAAQGTKDGGHGLAFQHAPQAHRGAAVRAAARVADVNCAPRRPNWCRRRRRRWW